MAFFQMSLALSNQTEHNKVTWKINRPKTMFGPYTGWVWGVWQTIYECVGCPFLGATSENVFWFLSLSLGIHYWANKELKCKKGNLKP